MEPLGKNERAALELAELEDGEHVPMGMSSPGGHGREADGVTRGPFVWRCKCGHATAEHDDREAASAAILEHVHGYDTPVD